MEVSTRKVTMIDNEPTDRFSDKVAGDKSSKSLLHQTGNSEQTLGHREKVKHMVYQNCRSTSISGHILYHMKCSVFSVPWFIIWSLLCPT
jgi:hypothetical protein